MSKKKINGKTLTIIILVVILLALIAASIYLVLKEDDKTPQKNEPNVAKEKTPEEKAKDLLYNVFLISYILEGDVQIGEGTLTIEGDDEEYYAVTDVLLEDFHSLSDITNLIENNLTEDAAARTRKIMESEYANQYTQSNNVLYVKKNSEPCKVMEGGPIDKERAEYRIRDGNEYIVYKNVPYQGYYDDKKNLKASALWFTCVHNFSSIGTGKNDKYDHENTEDNRYSEENQKEEDK